MIFYKAIKYTIFDFCIEKFFEKIYRNLYINIKELSIHDLRPGMYIKTIKDGKDIYNNCIIEDIDSYPDEIYVHFLCKDLGSEIPGIEDIEEYLDTDSDAYSFCVVENLNGLREKIKFCI